MKKSHIYREMEKGTFPPGHKIGAAPAGSRATLSTGSRPTAMSHDGSLTTRLCRQRTATLPGIERSPSGHRTGLT
ncbi:hypothetical protein [Stenotrophomonas indicatrix]|uniref:hypothetical protein n=1 Tax=Stenotrophomonas indicatrix TaxID=2045451 RepID=UPI003CCE181B